MSFPRSPSLGNPKRPDVRAALHYAKKRRLARLKEQTQPTQEFLAPTDFTAERT